MNVETTARTFCVFVPAPRARRHVFANHPCRRRPLAGRVSCFTSGAENLHHVEPVGGQTRALVPPPPPPPPPCPACISRCCHACAQVTGGTRFALTIAFTCDDKNAIPDPKGNAAATKPAVPDHIG